MPVARRRMAQSTSRVLSHRDRSDFDLMSAIVSSRIPGVRFTLDGAVHTEYSLSTVCGRHWLVARVEPAAGWDQSRAASASPAVAFSSHRSTTAARQRRWAPTLESPDPGEPRPWRARRQGCCDAYLTYIFSCIFVFFLFWAVNEKSNKKEEVQTRITNIFHVFLPWILPQHNKRSFTINNL